MSETSNVVVKEDSAPVSGTPDKINVTVKPAQLWEREFDIVEEGLDKFQVITFVTELIDRQQTLAERVKKLTIANDRLLFYFKNLIAETRILEEEIEQAVIEELQETSRLSLSISEVGNNGHKESLEGEIDCKSQLVSTGTSHEEMLEETIESSDKSAVPIALSEDYPLFEGEIEIIIAPPVDMAKLVRLRRNLQNVVHLKILRTDGCWTGANVFTAFADRPLPIISILMGIPEVKKANLWNTMGEESDDSSPWGLALEGKLGNWVVQKVIVWLKSVEGED